MSAAPLRVVQLLAPARFGGLETVVTALSDGLAARGHTVVVGAVVDPGTSPDDHPFLREIARTRAELRVLEVSRRGYLRERALVGALLDEVRPDALHTHGYRPDILDAPVARARGIRTVTTVHGFTRGGGRNRVNEWLQRRAFRRIDAVVAVSRPLREELARSGVPSDRLHLLPNALPALAPPLDAAAARERMGVPADEFHMAWIGRVSEEKGPDVLLDALARLTSGPWSCSIVGDGPLVPGLRAESEQRLPQRVRWQGVLEGASRYLPGVDCFVMSSRTEGTPMVLLEAMARGVPVVATAVGGIPDVADGVARLVPPEDPPALADALEEVRANPELRRRMAEDGIRRIEERFRPDGWLDGYERLFRGITGRRS